MAGDVKIERSQIISGSRVSQSRISNVTSERTAAMTPEMWQALFHLVDRHGKPRERDDARTLQTLLDRGQRRDAQPIWQHLRAFLGDFANVSKIVEAIDALMR